MALKGLTIPIWIGWLCGVLVLKRPWGTPSLPSWLTFSTLYCLFGLAMYCFLMADFALNNSGGLALGEEHRFGKYVRGFSVTQYAVITFLKRISFLLNAKRLGRLFEILSGLEEDHPHSNRHEKNDKKKNWWMCNIPVVSIMIFLSFTITLFSIASKGVEFVMQNSMKPSWVKMLGLGNWGYGIIYFLFAVMPLGIVSNVAYAIIMVTTFRVNQLFCDFCMDLRESLTAIILGESTDAIGCEDDDKKENRCGIYNMFKMTSKMDFLERKKIRLNLSGRLKVHPTKIHEMRKYPQEKFYSRKDVIDRFEELKDLMKLTNECLSALMLLMVCGMTLGIVANASQILVTGNTKNYYNSFNLATDILVLPILGIYAMLLELGHKIGQMVG